MKTSMTLPDSIWSCRLSRTDANIAAQLNLADSELDAGESNDGSLASPPNLWSILRELVHATAKGKPDKVDSGPINKQLACLPIAIQFDASAGAPFKIALGEAAAAWPETDLTAFQTLVDLLAASSSGSFQLRRCFYAGEWFSPGLRTARSKFCSARCRNRFNYELRVQGASFVCAECEQIYPIDGFSGLARERGQLQPSDIQAAQPVCTSCVVAHHDDWNSYLLSAALVANSTLTKTGSENYATRIIELISEALASTKAPMHYGTVANYVKARGQVKGRSPELTILGYLLRNPQRFHQVEKDSFTLSPRVRAAEARESQGASK